MARKFGALLVSVILAAGVVAITQMVIALLLQTKFNIANQDIYEDYSKAIWLAAMGFVFLVLVPYRNDLKKHLLALWGLRCAVTLVFMLFYEKFYDLDAYNYFLHAGPMEARESLDLGQGSLIVVQVIAFFREWLRIFDSYHAMKVMFSFFGLGGVYFFYRAIEMHLPKPDPRILWALGVFPSVIFWSSTLGKDPLVFLGIGMFAYSASGLLLSFRLRYLVIGAIGLFICSAIRSWLLPIFLMPFLLTVFGRARIGWGAKLAIVGMSLGFAALFSNVIYERFQIKGIDSLVERTDEVSKAWGSGGSGQEIPEFHSIGDVVKFMPYAMFTSLFRPLPGEVMNPFGLLAGFENLGILAVVGWGLYRLRREQWHRSIVIYAVLSVLIWSMSYGMVSAQNLGTASRFKLQILPLLLVIPVMAWLGRAGKTDDEGDGSQDDMRDRSLEGED